MPAGYSSTITGTTSADTLAGTTGNDTIDGGAGFDVAVFAGNYAGYQLTPLATGLIVSGSDGKDVLTGIERLQFSDVAVDVTINGAAETRVNTYTTGPQIEPFVIALVDGGWVAELVDALASGASDRKVVEVRVLSWAPSCCSRWSPKLENLSQFDRSAGNCSPRRAWIRPRLHGLRVFSGVGEAAQREAIPKGGAQKLRAEYFKNQQHQNYLTHYVLKNWMGRSIFVMFLYTIF